MCSYFNKMCSFLKWLFLKIILIKIKLCWLKVYIKFIEISNKNTILATVSFKSDYDAVRMNLEV